MNITTLSFMVWVAISVAACISSGQVYYELENHWIYLVPLCAFGVASAVTANISKNLPKAAMDLVYNIDGDRQIIGRLKRVLMMPMLVLLIGVIYMANQVGATVGVSIFEAQELRAAFYENLSALGGSYFIWLVWMVLAAASYLFVIGAASDAMEGRVGSAFTVVAFSLIVAWSLATGARMGILSALVIYIGIWRACARLRKASSSKLMVVLVAMSVPLLFQVVNRWDGSASGVAESTMLKYFVGPVFAFDQLILSGVVEDIRGELNRPGMSIIGFDTIVVSGMLRGVFGLDVGSALAASSAATHYGVEISDGVAMNAHYTAGSKWYFDFGVAGYVFFYCALAALLAYWDWRISRRPSGLVIVFSGYVLLSSVYSSREFIFDSPAYLISGALLWLTARRLAGRKIFKIGL